MLSWKVLSEEHRRLLGVFLSVLGEMQADGWVSGPPRGGLRGSHRWQHLPKGDMMPFTPMRAIRAKCLDCSGGQPKEVRECEVVHCSLWPYRDGHRPHKGTAEQKVHATADFFCHSPEVGLSSSYIPPSLEKR